MMTIWHLWNRLGLTRTARTAHTLTTSLRHALTPEEIRLLAAYNDDRYHSVQFPANYRTAMRALQDRYDASVREVFDKGGST